jgi:hypothetical protein
MLSSSSQTYYLRDIAVLLIQSGALKSSPYHLHTGDAGSALPHIQRMLNTFQAVHCHGFEFIFLNDCNLCLDVSASFKNTLIVRTLRLNKRLHGYGLLLSAPLCISIGTILGFERHTLISPKNRIFIYNFYWKHVIWCTFKETHEK